MISEKELNSYRLTSMEEPTDEMLAQIMHEAAEIYNRENQEAHDKLFADMQKNGKGTTSEIQFELMDTRHRQQVNSPLFLFTTSQHGGNQHQA